MYFCANYYLVYALLNIFGLAAVSQAIIPRPIITLHDGHIGLYDGLMETEYTGSIVAGRPYTLDIYMGNTNQYDYVIDQCTYNHRQTFIDQYGCLQNNNVFLQKWETDQYTNAGAIKRTLVHLVAEESILYFECQIKVLECCGCAEQSCERHPPISQYPIHPVPLTCCSPIPLPPPPPVVVPGHKDWFGLLPWWLWLLFLVLLLLLLTLLCCLLACCLAKNRARPGKVHANKTVVPIPAQQQQPPPIFRVDKVAQTLPEHRQISQQTSFDNYSLNSRVQTECNHATTMQRHKTMQFDDHASISLNDQKLTQVRSASASHESGRRRGAEREALDTRAYSGQATNFVHPFYSSPYVGQKTEHWEEQIEEYNESIIDTATHYENYPPPNRGENSSTIKRTRYVPVHRHFEPTIDHQQLQRELKENNVSRRQPRSRSHETITERREEEINRRRRSPQRDIFREEILRSMRQSSDI